jgi:hypothetical protein
MPVRSLGESRANIAQHALADQIGLHHRAYAYVVQRIEIGVIPIGQTQGPALAGSQEHPQYGRCSSKVRVGARLWMAGCSADRNSMVSQLWRRSRAMRAQQRTLQTLTGCERLQKGRRPEDRQRPNLADRRPLRPVPDAYTLCTSRE